MLAEKRQVQAQIGAQKTTNKNAPTQSSQPTRRPHINPCAANRGKTAKPNAGLVT